MQPPVAAREPPSPCVIVRHVDARSAQATTAGTTIVAGRGHGGRGCCRRDPEGPQWWSGSCDPWAA